LLKLPEGCLVAPPWRVEKNLEMLNSLKFSKRHRQIIKLCMTPLSSKQIAARLGISIRTMKVHLNAIYKKMKVKNRLHMIFYISDLLRPESKPVDQA
jgi:DNA-binding NarL/FixJ family response regulator